mmetsp:Transcript_46670/g.116944  ORF Transcript_46670/g.116944 Transcript_46670/m.116944 type:complete len:262 (-) Transcript_46670:11-796(-)|eukprot:CAMPEP_0173424124 /NCGR_PEP_ID=MMETSP1357-20121228/4125_1 /TAXON_ID=77926 /ORGANISM="Hemiselmis rufescens, Strain PCC563" /LENGTH=261 /DNA_ID=CAMNT_0014387299 /DNA_START=122 /DNA_END=907 /DNA_ORIENTATION=-
MLAIATLLLLLLADASAAFMPPPLAPGTRPAPRCAPIPPSGASCAAQRGEGVALNLFGWGKEASPKGPPAAAVSRELQDLLIEGQRSGGDLSEEQRARADELVTTLAASPVRWDPALLGGGPWRACYTKGPEPKWKALTRLLPFAKSRAYQDYDTATQSVTNVGEVLGDALKVQAFGTYKEFDAKTTTPKDYEVTVTRGEFKLPGGLSFGLSISGVGYQRVQYADANVRVFESINTTPTEWEREGLVVVQVPEAALKAAGV